MKPFQLFRRSLRRKKALNGDNACICGGWMVTWYFRPNGWANFFEIRYRISLQ